eukprot:CCRYP_015269-RA/>CCRYP_015269-RA protein AED:0.39 eAED:0.69 QI:0/0/0/1/1/1/2/0/125
MGVRDSRAVSTACSVSAIHAACKQMGLDTDFTAAEKAVETAKIEVELAKQECVTARNAEKKKKGNKQEARGCWLRHRIAAGAKPFELYGNVLSDEAAQPWEKIIKAQVTKAPWEDIKGVPHAETP